ncbi:src domain protein 3, partial [Musa troglodytarum]
KAYSLSNSYRRSSSLSASVSEIWVGSPDSESFPERSPPRRRMEALRKQASKLREQVARQQQAVFKQFGGGGYGSPDSLFADAAEYMQHQKIEKLYLSTRAAKHFQRDIVRGVEGYIVTGSKQVEIGNKLSEDSRKYGVGNTCTSGNTLSNAALSYARARSQMENEHGNLLKALGTQVAEPLRAMVVGAPLEDARHLAQRYDRMRQEAEAQATEVSKRHIKVRETAGTGDNISKLEAAEAKLQELKSNMAATGKEAVAAMAAVEAQQQRLTLQRLIAMVESEHNYHQKILQILEQLEAEMLLERQRIEASPNPVSENFMPPPPSYEEASGFFGSSAVDGTTETVEYFLAEVINSYQAETDVELNLSVGDYVVVRKVSDNGWAEGECKGKAGWFPCAYIEKRERVLASCSRITYASYWSSKLMLHGATGANGSGLRRTNVTRRFCQDLHLFPVEERRRIEASPKHAESWLPIPEEVDAAVCTVAKHAGSAFNVRDLAFTLTKNIVFRAAFGKRSDENQEEYIAVVQEISTLLGVFSVGDFIPWLSWMDPQGINKRLRVARATLDLFIDRIIDEHMASDAGNADMVGVMLAFLEESSHHHGQGEGDDLKGTLRLSRANIRAVMMDVMFGGTETVAIAIEWALADLLTSPDDLKRVQEELAMVVGLHRKVHESDLDKLSFLKCAIKETLRLHPPFPLLLHQTAEHCEVAGHDQRMGHRPRRVGMEGRRRISAVTIRPRRRRGRSGLQRQLLRVPALRVRQAVVPGHAAGHAPAGTRDGAAAALLHLGAARRHEADRARHGGRVRAVGTEGGAARGRPHTPTQLPTELIGSFLDLASTKERNKAASIPLYTPLSFALFAVFHTCNK